MNHTTETETEKEDSRQAYHVWLTLCWLFGIRHRLYYEKQPKIGDIDVTMQRLVIILSRGRLTWGKTAVSECKCKVCGRKFWTLTKNSTVCRRYGCYMKFHLYPEQFTLQITESEE